MILSNIQVLIILNYLCLLLINYCKNQKFLILYFSNPIFKPADTIRRKYLFII